MKFSMHQSYFIECKLVLEFMGYIRNNAGLICNYGERFGAGQIISTANIESLVNSRAAKRFAK